MHFGIARGSPLQNYRHTQPQFDENLPSREGIGLVVHRKLRKAAVIHEFAGNDDITNGSMSL